MSQQLEKIKELIAKREQARLGGGEKAIEKQHARGKYTARERIDMLLDEGSFEEVDMFKLHRCTNFGMEKKQYLGDGDLQGDGPRHEDGCSRYRYQRLWWCSYPGRYQRIGRIC